MGSVVKVDSKKFEEILRSDKLVIVDFFATWCGPCKKIAPQVEAIAKDHPNIAFLKIDVDECEELASEYRISAMPSFVAFKNGKEVGRVIGADLEQVKTLLTK